MIRKLRLGLSNTSWLVLLAHSSLREHTVEL